MNDELSPVSGNVTDDQQELFDVVNERDVIIGTAFRGDVHRNPNLIHRSIAVIVFNDKGEILLQKRSLTKDTYPGYWTASCTGHVRSGESYEEAAAQEMAEELGLAIHPSALQFLFKQPVHFPQESEMMFVYAYRASKEEQSLIKFNTEEIECVQFLTIEQILLEYSAHVTPDLKIILNRMNDLTT